MKVIIQIIIVSWFNISLSFLPLANEKMITMADQKMIKILNMQEELFSIENQRLSKDELTRKAQDLVVKYESYLSDNPSDVTALLLFKNSSGKLDRMTML